RHYRVTDVAEGKAVMDANHPLAGWTLRFDVKVLDVEQPDGDKVGSDDVVVPGFLGFADKIIDDEQDDGPDEEAELNRRLGGGA
ncbi:MAG TPA: peptidylprolyl isomerase, partial [Sutterella sp.]|nr:peptidylprolyl isomerase [Sutterella sp.]